MSRQELKHKAYLARLERIFGHMQAGWTAKEIGQREGLEPDHAGRIMRNLAKQRGYKAWTRKKLRAELQDKIMPYGMTNDSAIMRLKLGDHISRLREKGELPADLGNILGLTETQQRLARQSPANCDWTISQMERLARYLGKDFISFMKDLLVNDLI